MSVLLDEEEGVCVCGKSFKEMVGSRCVYTPLSATKYQMEGAKPAEHSPNPLHRRYCLRKLDEISLEKKN